MGDNSQKPEEKNTSCCDGVDLTKTLYAELHKLAVARMSREYRDQTLQATALIHEAWLRMGGDQQPQWVNRAEFLSAAAKTMRRILIDRARRRQAIRHGGAHWKVELDTWNWERLEPMDSARNDRVLIALDTALRKLAAVDRESADIVELRYFAGVHIEQISDLMGFSSRTATRRLSFARAWLEDQMQGELAS